ncbi:MAG TPA: AI-2E family transporter [Candidatus Saccharimonadales bacterium]
MKVNIQIDTQTFVRFWLVMIGFALAGLMIYSAMSGLIIVGTALFLALALNGPVTRLANFLPGKSRVGSTAIAYLLVIAFLGAFTFLAVPPIVQQTAKFAATVPDLVDNATNSWHSLDKAIDDYNLRPQVDEALGTLKKNATTWASNVGSNVVSGVGSFFGFITSLILTLVLSFLMLVEGPEWMKRIWGLYRNKRRMEHHRKTVTRMSSVVSGFVTGQLTVSALGATLAGLAVFIIALFVKEVPTNLAVPTAAIVFVFSLIPMFGAVISAVLVCLLIGFNSIPAAIVYGIYFLIYQQIENNFVSPAIQSRKLELSPLLILIAVTVGIYVFGIAGAIISIPVAGCLKVLLEEYLVHARDEREKQEKPIEKLVKKIKQV